MYSDKIAIKKVLIILLIGGFLVKLFIGFKVSDSFLQRGNSKTYLNALASNLYLHGEYSLQTGIPSIDYEPLFPMLMSIAYGISGYNWLGLTVIQGLLHLFTSLLIFKIASKWFHPIAGFFAALYHACYPYLFTYAISIYDTTLFVFLLVSAVYLILNQPLTTNRLLLAGFVTGLAFLTRATIIAFLPAFLFYIIYSHYKNHKNILALRPIVYFTSALLITLLPWLIRNYHYTGKILISTHGSFGLWQGNNPLTYDYLKANRSLDEIYRLNPPPAIYMQYPLAARMPADAVRVSNAYQQEATTWIKHHFTQFMQLGWIKVQKLWTWNRNPDSRSVAYGSNEGRRTVYLISYLPLLLLFPAGLFIFFKKQPAEAFTLLLILLAFTGAHAIAIGFTRARIPIDFILMISTGITLCTLIQHFFPAFYSKFSFNEKQ
jgi:4-amino-4-deoxy-L-arabinose transferase-like glycosyltransferase